MTKAFDHYTRLTTEETCRGKAARLSADAANTYISEQLAIIPAGTVLKLDFASDFGCYAVADVSGILHRVKLEITDLHKIEFLPEPQDAA